MKDIKIIIFIIIIFFISSALIEAKVKMQNNIVNFKEELYFNKQIPITIKPGSKLESIFYFNNQLTTIPQPLNPVQGKYKTRLKIPKATLN